MSERGWSIAFHTALGVVALLNADSKDQLVICYPLSTEEMPVPSIEQKDILHILPVTISKSTEFRSKRQNSPMQGVEKLRSYPEVCYKTENGRSYAESPRRTDRPKSDKPKAPVVRPLQVGEARWTPYYGEQCVAGGRVWVDHNNDSLQGYTYQYVDNDTLHTVMGGHDLSMTVCTFPYNYHEDEFRDAPTTNPADIQKFVEPFFQLAKTYAEKLGIVGISVCFHDVNVADFQDVVVIQGEGTDQTLIGKKANQVFYIETSNSHTPNATCRLAWENQTLEQLLTL